MTERQADEVATVILDLVKRNSHDLITAPDDPGGDANELQRLQWKDTHSSRWQHLTRCRDTTIQNLTTRTGFIGYCQTCTESVLVVTCDVACTCHYREDRVVWLGDDGDCMAQFGAHLWELDQ